MMRLLDLVPLRTIQRRLFYPMDLDSLTFNKMLETSPSNACFRLA